jgi:hypothetical protein
MKTFTVTIPDNKENNFVALMKSISFVKNIEIVSDDIEIPQWHKTILDQRLECKSEDSVSWDDVQKEIKIKYGL